MRVVSVLFNDLVGFTTLSESMPAEDVRELQSHYFAAARRAVTKYGGVIEKFIGDAVMAVFGAEVSTGDDAARAVRAGLELVKVVSDLGATEGLDLAARAGVCTGRTAVVAAEGEGLVTGDTVNTAARIQSAAGPGQVFVDESTRSLALATIKFAPAGSFELKGKALPLQLFHAIGSRDLLSFDQPSIQSMIAPRTPPFVGRDAVVDTLLAGLERSMQSSSVGVALITGAAGAGKTRLLAELNQRLTDHQPPILWQLGLCLAFGDGVANAALAQAFRQRFAIAPTDPVGAANDRLAAELPKYVGDEDLLAWIRPRVAALLGLLPGAAPFPRDELFGAWRALFEEMSRTAPVVLVIDDAEYVDQSTTEFVTSLLQWSGGHRIFVVISGREGFLERLGWQADTTGSVMTLRLQPLTSTETAEILHELAPELSSGAIGTLAAAAEGNPLFALELLRSLADRGLLHRSVAGYQLVGDEAELAALDLPPTLGALTGARLDALPQPERQLVRDLSVLGMDFPRSAVPAVCRPTPSGEDFNVLLDSLVNRQVLETVEPDDSHYGDLSFSSALLRSVAYERLTRRERRSLHLAAAAHLEAGFDRESPELAGPEAPFVEVVASHYSAALVAVPEAVDAPEVRRKAVLAYIAAGDQALQVGHPAGAEAHFIVAGELASDHELGIAARSFEKAGEAANLLGEFARSIEAFNRASALYENGGATRAAARCRGKSSGSHNRMGNLEEGVRGLKAALEVLDIGAPDVDAAQVAWRIARALLDTGQAEAARPYVDMALAGARALSDWPLTVQVLSLSGFLMDTLGRGAEAGAMYDEAVEIGREFGLTRNLADALTNGGESKAVNDLPGAGAWGEEALVLFSRLGDLPNARLAAANVLLFDCFVGRWDAIDALVAGHLEGAGCEYVHAKLALFSTWKGDLEAARSHLERASSWATSGLIWGRAIYLIGAGAVALAAGDAAGALAAACEVADEFHERSDLYTEEMRLAWPLALEAAIAAEDEDAAGRIFAMLSPMPDDKVPPYLLAEKLRLGSDPKLGGPPEVAGQDLRRSVAILDQLGYPYHAAKARADLAAALLAAGDDSDALAAAAEAVATLSALGAAPALARASSLLSRATSSVALPANEPAV
jgi:class 3 adenylate cyclase/tetratricopeptide (TPR) repeat protein